MNHFWAAASFALALNMSAAAAQDVSSARPRRASSAPDRALTSNAPAHEAGGDVVPAPFDATMTLVGEGENLLEAVTNNIDLPPDDSGAYLVSPRAASRAAHGLSNANLARENGRAFGLAVSESAGERTHARIRAAAVMDAREVWEAREASRAFAEAAAAAAEQSREDLVHTARPALGVLPGDRVEPAVTAHASLPAISGRL